MNIACFTHYFTPEIGAPSARIYDMSIQWLAQGHGVDVVTCFPNHPEGVLYPGYTIQKYQYEKLDGIHVHRNWTYIAANIGLIRKTVGHLSLWPSCRIHSDKYLHDPDITIGTSPTFFAAMAASGAARRLQIPFIMDIRDLWPAVFVDLGIIRNRLIIRILEKWEMSLYRQATKIVTVTEAFRQNLVGRGIPAKKIHTIPNGADTDFLQPRDHEHQLRNKLNLRHKFIVLYIGAHGISHGLINILDCAERLRDIGDIHFMFVGTGAEKKMLVAKRRSKNLSNVTFHEPVTKKEVPDFYAMADVCLVPLRNIPLFDSFIPSKMFEIMAIGRPIIGSVRGEAADILSRSGGALVVKPEDSEALANAIIALRNDPDKRRLMCKNGRQFVVKYYSRKILATKYLDVMHKAIQEQAA